MLNSFGDQLSIEIEIILVHSEPRATKKAFNI